MQIYIWVAIAAAELVALIWVLRQWFGMTKALKDLLGATKEELEDLFGLLCKAQAVVDASCSATGTEKQSVFAAYDRCRQIVRAIRDAETNKSSEGV